MHNYNIHMQFNLEKGERENEPPKEWMGDWQREISVGEYHGRWIKSLFT